eukprot:g9434.t1
MRTGTMSTAQQTANEVAKYIQASKDASAHSQQQYEETLRERLQKGVTWTQLPPPEGRCIKHTLPTNRRRSLSKGFGFDSMQLGVGLRRSSRVAAGSKGM